MKKFNITASLLLDAIFSFSMIITICILFLPMLIQLNNSKQDKLQEIEQKKIIVNTLYHYQNSQLRKGINIENYFIKRNNIKICITKLGEKNERCYKK